MSNKQDRFSTALAEERALPSSGRMLRGIQATLQKIAGTMTDQQSLFELSNIDLMLSELSRREDVSYYAGYYGDMRSLLVEGLSLLRAGISAEATTRIETELEKVLPTLVEANVSYEYLTLQINRTMRHLSVLVRPASDKASPQVKKFLQRVVAAETGFHVHRAQHAASRQKIITSEKPPLTAERLENYLREREPDRTGLRVTSFRQLIGGYQKVTVMFETEDDTGCKDSLVLRCEKDDKFVALDASDIRREFEIVQFLRAHDVPVAEPMWIEDDESKLGNRFFVSRRIIGENQGEAVGSHGITDDIVRSYMEGVAKLHRIPHSDAMRKLAVGHWLDYATTQDNERANILYWRNQPWLKTFNPSPLTERVTAWLLDNIPQGDIPLGLIHCDYGPHNTLVHNGKLVGIVDWESCRIGDPAEDVSWLLQSCGGQVDYGKAIDAYEEFTGHRISEYRLRYYDVFGCLKVMTAVGSVESMYEAHDEASVTWLTLSFRYGAYGSSELEKRIAIAEAAKGK